MRLVMPPSWSARESSSDIRLSIEQKISTTFNDRKFNWIYFPCLLVSKLTRQIEMHEINTISIYTNQCQETIIGE